MGKYESFQRQFEDWVPEKPSPERMDTIRAELDRKDVKVGQIRKFQIDESPDYPRVQRPTFANGKMVKIKLIDKYDGLVQCEFIELDDPVVKDLRERVGVTGYSGSIEDLFNE